jgi:hypothetical protein
MSLPQTAASAATPDPKSLIDWHRPPTNTDECLMRIEVLTERLQNHLRFIQEIQSLHGVSTEMKCKAATSFYERLLQLDRALGKLGDELRLS